MNIDIDCAPIVDNWISQNLVSGPLKATMHWEESVVTDNWRDINQNGPCPESVSDAYQQQWQEDSSDTVNESSEEELDSTDFRNRTMSIDDGFNSGLDISDRIGCRHRTVSVDEGNSSELDLQFRVRSFRQRTVSVDDSAYSELDITDNSDQSNIRNNNAYHSEGRIRFQATTSAENTNVKKKKFAKRRSSQRNSKETSPFGSFSGNTQNAGSEPSSELADDIYVGESDCCNVQMLPTKSLTKSISDNQYIDREHLAVTLNSFLCGERVTQMTKTYSDLEAVTRLLEEKERDLELAARIGQTLLGKNRELSSRSDILDEQLSHANDKISQLKHDLCMKEELLRFYCQDLQDDSSRESSPGDAPTLNLSKFNIDILQRKVHTLEEENINLRLESAQLRSETDNYEEKEKKLVEDCLQQLAEVNQQVETLAEELRFKNDENSRHKEEITALLAQVADLHKRVRQLTIENMDLAEKLQASQESQKQLTRELSIQKDKYDELFEMLEQAQDELRSHRHRGNPRARRHNYASAALPSAVDSVDSLASELQNSLHLQDKKEHSSRNWKIFETAKAARKAASKASREGSVRMSVSSTSSLRDPNSLVPSNVASDSESNASDGYSGDMDSMYGSNPDLGRPGIPGSNDLESALRRLAMRRANEMNERDYHRRQEFDRECRSEGISPYPCATPDGILTPPSGYLGYNSHSVPHFKMSDKLQIIKPLEGSMTLRHWQNLARPHLGGLFERREGVQVKGERKLDLEGEVYTLSDFEEDDISECPSRRMADSSSVYTYTNSTVKNPGDVMLSQSIPVSGHFQPEIYSTPKASIAKSRSNTSSTYTMSLGLAAILEGREASSTPPLRPIASCSSIMTTQTSGQTIVPMSIPVPTSATSSSVTAETIESMATSPLSGAVGSNLLGKLISTGYSMLWNKPVPPQTLASVVPNAVSDAGSSTDEAKPMSKPTTSQIFPKDAATGVLSAITSFRKNGIL